MSGRLVPEDYDSDINYDDIKKLSEKIRYKFNFSNFVLYKVNSIIKFSHFYKN